MAASFPSPTVPLDAQVIAVLRARHASEYAPIIECLVAGGIRFIELTLTTGAVFDHLLDIRTKFGDAAQIGVGTITTVAEAEQSVELGAQFIVTPTMNLDVVRMAVAHGIPVIPGGLSPTELHAGWTAGAAAVKVFPATAVGPEYVGQVRGPFPDMQLIPSGGVSIQDAPRWILAGALAVSLGGPLLGDAFNGGSLQQLTDRARHVTALVTEAAQARTGSGQ